MTDRSAQTAAVLDEMVAGIMGVKAAKATQLTPVGMEGVRLPKIAAPFPNDNPQEVVESAIRVIEREIGHLQDVVAALRNVTGQPAPTNEPVVSQREIEKAADERAAGEEDFATKFARMSEEAQASVFKPAAPVLADLDAVETPQSDWLCPTHGDESIANMVSGRGRKYAACTVAGCKEFQRA